MNDQNNQGTGMPVDPMAPNTSSAPVGQADPMAANATQPAPVMPVDPAAQAPTAPEPAAPVAEPTVQAQTDSPIQSEPMASPTMGTPAGTDSTSGTGGMPPTTPAV